MVPRPENNLAHSRCKGPYMSKSGINRSDGQKWTPQCPPREEIGRPRRTWGAQRKISLAEEGSQYPFWAHSAQAWRTCTESLTGSAQLCPNVHISIRTKLVKPLRTNLTPTGNIKMNYLLLISVCVLCSNKKNSATECLGSCQLELPNPVATGSTVGT